MDHPFDGAGMDPYFGLLSGAGRSAAQIAADRAQLEAGAGGWADSGQQKLLLSQGSLECAKAALVVEIRDAQSGDVALRWGFPALSVVALAGKANGKPMLLSLARAAAEGRAPGFGIDCHKTLRRCFRHVRLAPWSEPDDGAVGALALQAESALIALGEPHYRSEPGFVGVGASSSCPRRALPTLAWALEAALGPRRVEHLLEGGGMDGEQSMQLARQTVLELRSRDESQALLCAVGERPRPLARGPKARL